MKSLEDLFTSASGNGTITYINIVKKYVKGMVIYMSKFEKKFGKYAIRNLSLMLIICYAVGYIIQLINQDFLYFLTLNPYEILHVQVCLIKLSTW